MSDDLAQEKRALIALEEAFDMPSDKRVEWLRQNYSDDPELLGRVLQLLRLESETDSALKTGGAGDYFEENIQLERAGQYRITGLIGRGGMGTVYTAEREAGDFQHSVAVKVIRPGVLSDALIGRFENERQILADLNHPNIARLFDGGTLSDGSPFIIMEYVDGAPVTEWVEEHDLSLDERLRIFTVVCDAVSYAHQNLIVHRDITPSNVMMSKEGDVKLIDFGIAKPHEVDAAETSLDDGSLASLTFTPGFAAPERAKGAVANTLSDVYSLGRLLASILGGRTLSKEIEKIIQTATAAAPSDRYASVAALSEDVSNFMTALPVDAMNGGSLYRISKFIRRNRLFVSFGTLAIASLTGALALTFVQFQTAQRERDIADKRFNDVRSLANTMMFDVYDEIEFISGTSQAKTQLAEAAQEYLSDLSASAGGDVELKLEAAKGYIRLATITGNPTEGAKTDLNAASESYASAEALLEEIRSIPPENDEVLFQLSRVNYLIADTAMITEKNLDKAQRRLERSISILQAYKNQTSELPDRFQEAILKSQTLLSVAYGQDGRAERSIKLAKEVADKQMEIALSNIDDHDRVREANVALNNLGRQMVRMENYDAAIESYTSSLDIIRPLVEANPDNERFRRDISYTYWRRAHAYSRIQDGERSLSDFQNAAMWMKRVADADPENSNHQEFLEVIIGESMLAYKHLGDFETAERIGLSYISRMQSFIEKKPNDQNLERDVLVGYWNLIGLYSDFDRTDKECNSIKTVLSISDAMEKKGTLLETDRAGLEEFRTRLQSCPTE